MKKNINMQTTKSPEFDGWRWVSFWYPVRQVVSFKKDVYRKAMKEFSNILFSDNPPIHTTIYDTEQKHYSYNKKRNTSKYSKRPFYKTRNDSC